MENTKPRLPEKGEFVRHHGILIDVKTIQPPTPKPYKEYIFEERSAREEFRFKDGCVLETLSTVNDFYGFGAGEKEAIEEFENHAKARGMDKNCDVEAVVVRIVRQFKAKPKRDINFYDKKFFDFEEHRHCPDLKNEEVDVWSSKRGYLLKDENIIEEVKSADSSHD